LRIARFALGHGAICPVKFETSRLVFAQTIPPHAQPCVRVSWHASRITLRQGPAELPAENRQGPASLFFQQAIQK